MSEIHMLKDRRKWDPEHSVWKDLRTEKDHLLHYTQKGKG